MKTLSTKAFVLKKINYGDADKIYTLFTRDSGKISAIARGVRKISSKRSGNLDTLNLISVSMTKSGAGFSSITEVKTLESFKEIKSTLEISMKGYYIAELVLKSLEEGHESAGIFDLMNDSLRMFANHKLPPNLVTSYFEIHFMEQLGYQLVFDKCTVCGRPLSKGWSSFRFNFNLGGFVCENCRKDGIHVSRIAAVVLYNLYKKRFSAFEGILQDKLPVKEIDTLLKNYINLQLGEKFKSLEIEY
jgi:DNA repair protein RecO (recombination protein O)